MNTKNIVDKYGFKFSKSLGQNFLIDDSVLYDIVNGAKVNKDDFIIEIGPGVGTLTKVLLENAREVCSIELDSRLIPILQEELSDYDNFKLINEDALKVDFHKIIGEEKSVKVVANLPYYVTTPIISNLLLGRYNFKSITIMIQKEVAERINAQPGTKDYGALTLLVQYFCNTKILRKVAPSCFIPSPKVESIVIRLDKTEEPKVKVEDEKLFFKVVRDSFSMRRKTLWNNLKSIGLDKKYLEEAFENAKIDPKRRAETLNLDEFAILSNEIYIKKQIIL